KDFAFAVPTTNLFSPCLRVSVVDFPVTRVRHPQLAASWPDCANPQTESCSGSAHRNPESQSRTACPHSPRAAPLGRPLPPPLLRRFPPAAPLRAARGAPCRSPLATRLSLSGQSNPSAGPPG